MMDGMGWISYIDTVTCGKFFVVGTASSVSLFGEYE